MRILHVTSWFPNEKAAGEAPWIRNHINALGLQGHDQEIIHVRVLHGKMNLTITNEFDALHYIVHLPFKIWLITELFSSFLVMHILRKKRANINFDVINFHIAYPNLTFWHLVKRWISIPIIITEHWSAYHLNFGLKQPPKRVQRIFNQKIPVITVSRALADDIMKFSNALFPVHIIPNVIDNDIFNLSRDVARERQTFIMISQWKPPKRPEIAIEAFIRLMVDFPDVKMKIVGVGPQLDEMKDRSAGIENIEFHGTFDPIQIVDQLQKATALVHASDYETFSVVCAEALYCNCPVIASMVGGIPEFVNEENGLLISENSADEFYEAMKRQIEKPVSVLQKPSFGKEEIGLQYSKVLKKIVDLNG